MNKFDKVMFGVCEVIQLGCVLGLAGIALKRNQDAYDASCERLNAELDNIAKDIEIHKLEREVKELKEKYESEKVEEA